jgi:hypothetical protein
MSESEPGPPRTPADLAAYWRTATERMMAGWTAAATGATGGGGGAAAGGPRPPALPAFPATLSAQQLQAVLDDLAARRAQVQALSTQLAAFDEQLASLEATLSPVVDWVRTWADLEKSVGEFWRPGGPSSGPGKK